MKLKKRHSSTRLQFILLLKPVGCNAASLQDVGFWGGKREVNEVLRSFLNKGLS